MMVLVTMMELYDKVRWVLVTGVWFLALMSETYWLGIIALVIAFWPKPEERQDFFYGANGILNKDKPKY